MTSSFLSPILKTLSYSSYHSFVQMTTFACLSYLSTACLTSISPKSASVLMINAYLISQWITPLFVQFFEPYQEIALVPLIGQVMQLTLSLILAKTVCHIIGFHLSFKEVRDISLVFLMSLSVLHYTLDIFRKKFKAI